MKILKSSPGLLFLSFVFVFLSTAPVVFFTADYAIWRENWWAAGPIALLAVLAMLLLPALTVRKLFRENLSDYGFRFPEDFRQSVFLTVIAVIVLLPAVLFFGLEESFREYYFVSGLSLSRFIYAGVLASIVYYAAEEFLFRGFLFWGLWRKIGRHSFWVTALVFAAFHITKPAPEVIFAFFAGIVFNYLSFKTKSFIPAAAAHFVLALVLNVMIFFFLENLSAGTPGAFRF